MSLQLVIDTKEKAASSGIIRDYLEAKGVRCVSQPLDVGDLAIIDESGNSILLLERKTCKDIAASIGDGRYREQKTRLMSHGCRWKGYLLEGTFPEEGILVGRKRVTKTTFYSVIAGITLRDGLHVFMCPDIYSSAQLLGQLMIKIPEYLRGDGQPQYEESLIKSVSTVRKENMTPEVCYLAQLCQIPGISHSIATKIKEHYSSMKELLGSNQATLAEINTGGRRLGGVLAARICEYMGLSAPAPTPSPAAKKTAPSPSPAQAPATSPATSPATFPATFPVPVVLDTPKPKIKVTIKAKNN